MSNVLLVWATPDADKQIVYIARVSAPANQASESIEGEGNVNWQQCRRPTKEELAK